MYDIQILPFAELDIKESVEFYCSESSELASRFLEQLDSSFEEISDKPDLYRIVKFDIRKYQMKNFPFSIFYMQKQLNIYILAVFHNKRNPIIWESRIRAVN